mmetsp:Transcript_16591/g.19217  ORF Transcript_16591/g.19217 Transcript_16591/m.19217 type:complete len:317 (-) Transcript_16591:1605-2555(-)
MPKPTGNLIEISSPLRILLTINVLLAKLRGICGFITVNENTINVKNKERTFCIRTNNLNGSILCDSLCSYPNHQYHALFLSHTSGNACTTTRRSILLDFPTKTIIPMLPLSFALSQQQPQAAFAKTQLSSSTASDEINIIIEASETIDKLLSNWERATVDCTYADVPRELLETKNKEQLLEKASTFALFDKSTSVVSCKKTNKIVRDYIGVTGKGPLVNIDKRMLKRVVVDNLDPDVLDEYYSEVESFQNYISRASSLSYAAGVADFDSMNNFEKGKSNNDAQGDSNLEQARKAINDAKVSLDKIVSFLKLDNSDS